VYGVLCGGTTTTGALQIAGAETANYALISNGSSALPTWQQASHLNILVLILILGLIRFYPNSAYHLRINTF